VWLLDCRVGYICAWACAKYDESKAAASGDLMQVLTEFDCILHIAEDAFVD